VIHKIDILLFLHEVVNVVIGYFLLNFIDCYLIEIFLEGFIASAPLDYDMAVDEE
jgi:hypothetical protein